MEVLPTVNRIIGALGRTQKSVFIGRFNEFLGEYVNRPRSLDILIESWLLNHLF
jgi:hypothetical protein